VDAYLYLRTEPGTTARVATTLPTLPGVRRAVVVVGAWDVLAILEGADLEQIATTVLARVHQVEGVRRTLTVPVVPPDLLAPGGFGAPAPPALIAGACYVHIQADPGAAPGIAERLSELEDVSGVAVTGGTFDLLACVAQPWEVASGTILERIQALPGVRSTSTLVSIAYEEPEEDRDQFSAWT
jgi:DNA-binding Lrp family transcriptional regulator